LPRDKKTLWGDADLTGVAKFGRHRTRSNLFEIDIGEDEHGRVAAKLQRESRHGLGRAVHQMLAYAEAAGQMDLRAAGVPQHFLPNRVGLAIDEVRRAGW
jgi:hypothetical protein